MTAAGGNPSLEAAVATPATDTAALAAGWRRHARFAVILAGAGVLEVAAWLLESGAAGLPPYVHARLFDLDGARQVAFLVLVVLAWLVPADTKRVVGAATAALLPAMVHPALAAVLLLSCVATWRVAGLRLPLLARIGLTLLVAALPPVLRLGWVGPGLAAACELRSGFETLFWGIVLLRSLMYQVERSRLPEADRGLLAYLGSYAVVPLVGTAYLPPIPYRAMFKTADDRLRCAARGLGLMALGLAYHVVGYSVVMPHIYGPLGAWGSTLRGGWVAPGPREVVALILYLPGHYLLVASVVFRAVGHLRLLGLDLGSGFRAPFVAQDCVDYWKRWNYYYYQAMTLVFYPALDGLRRRVRSTAVQTLLAIGAAFACFILVRDLLTPLTQGGAFPLGHPAVFPARHLVDGAATALTAYWLVRRRSRRPPGTARRVLATAATLLFFATGAAVAFVAGAALSAR